MKSAEVFLMEEIHNSCSSEAKEKILNLSRIFFLFQSFKIILGICLWIVYLNFLNILAFIKMILTAPLVFYQWAKEVHSRIKFQ